jgi:hypothetical protein
MKNQRYPENFGEQLSRLVISLPPPIRKLNGLFPLLPMDSCINLSQHAKKPDMADVWQLQKAAFGEGLSRLPYPVDKTEKAPSHKDSSENEMVERLLSELSEENLAEKFGFLLDEARLRYATETVKVRDSFEFNDAITAFYAHLFRHTASPFGHAELNVLLEDAIKLVKKAFKHKGGYKGALSEGKYGTHGGMRVVFDAMTEQEKQDRKTKYISAVFKKTIDSFDKDAQVRLMKAFMDRIGPGLPADLRDLPAEKLASHWETIIRHYTDLKEKVSDLLKRL